MAGNDRTRQINYCHSYCTRKYTSIFVIVQGNTLSLLLIIFSTGVIVNCISKYTSVIVNCVNKYTGVIVNSRIHV